MEEESRGSMILKAFLFLIEISLKASIIVLMIYLLKWTIGRKLSANWNYLIWFLVVLALIIPIFPLNQFVELKKMTDLPELDIQEYTYDKIDRALVYQKNNQFIIQDEQLTSIDLKLQEKLSDSSMIGEQNDELVSSKTIEKLTMKLFLLIKYVVAPENLFNMAFIFSCIIWFSIFVVKIIEIIIFNFDFSRGLKKERLATSSNLYKQMAECAHIVGLNRIPKTIYTTEYVNYPAVYKAFRPQLLVPRDFENKVDRDEMKLILLHEMIHIKRHDILINMILSILQSVHWFNPFVKIAFDHMRADAEMACDEMVLKYCEQKTFKEYGHLIINLLRLGDQKCPPSIAGMSIQKKFVKRRIEMISRFGIQRRTLRILSALIVLAASIITTGFALNSSGVFTNSAVASVDSLSNKTTTSVEQIKVVNHTSDFVNQDSNSSTKQMAINPDKLEVAQLTSSEVSEDGVAQDINKNIQTAENIKNKESTEEINDTLKVIEIKDPLETTEVPETTEAKIATLATVEKEETETNPIVETPEIKVVIPTIPKTFEFIETEFNGRTIKIYKGQNIIDDINLPFVDDPLLLGAWETIDYVPNIKDFIPGQRYAVEDLFLKKLDFLDGGESSMNQVYSWTKGFVLNRVDNTAGAYTITQMEEKTYMFMQWKSGDYFFWGRTPFYYVLKKVE